MEAVLDLDDQLQPAVAVGQVDDVGDALQLLGLHRVLDAVDDALGPDVEGQLGDHDAAPARGDLLDAGAGPHAEAAPPGLVGVAHAVEADDDAAAGEVGPGHERHDLGERRVRVVEQVAGRVQDLAEVVRDEVGGHADGDAGGAVDEQVRDGGREHDRLGLAAVVVGPEVDDVLVEAGGHVHGGAGEPCLGVAHGRRAVVEGAEVAVPVDHRQAQGERLRHADEGVVDRRVAVRMQPAHDLADDAGALDVPAVGSQSHLRHLEQDAPLDRLQAVARVGQGAGVDDRVGVLEERAPHLLGDVDVDDAAVAGCLCPAGRAACHGVLSGWPAAGRVV